MADVAVTYTLTTPGPDITFNGGELGDGQDLFYITEISGLGGPPLRTPIDNVPLGDGGLVHTFYKGPRHVIVEGVLLIQSSMLGTQCQTIRNDMEEDLTDALESIIAANGTLAWTPLGQGSRSLTVRHDVQLEFTHIENYLLESFTFGLVAANPDW